jgi:DNA-binding NtrC family response regulator
MATESITHGVLIVASEAIGAEAAQLLGEQPGLRAKAVNGARQALGAVGQVNPHILVFEAGLVPVPAMQAVKNMAELAASRPVPLIMVGGPLNSALEQQRQALGIVNVLDGAFDGNALLDAIQALIEKWEQARRESQLRKAKQMQIQERLRTASNKYMAMSEEAAKQRLPQPDVQDFASDDIAPAAEPDPNKPPDEPTWDGSKTA